MRTNYIVSWWCDKSDSSKKRHFHKYTDALEFESKMKAKSGTGDVRLSSA